LIEIANTFVFLKSILRMFELLDRAKRFETSIYRHYEIGDFAEVAQNCKCLTGNKEKEKQQEEKRDEEEEKEEEAEDNRQRRRKKRIVS